MYFTYTSPRTSLNSMSSFIVIFVSHRDRCFPQISPHVQLRSDSHSFSSSRKCWMHSLQQFRFRNKEGVLVQSSAWQSFTTHDLPPRPRDAEATLICHQPAQVHPLPRGIVNYLLSMVRMFSKISRAGTVYDAYNVSICFVDTSHTAFKSRGLKHGPCGTL